ncbi:glycosyltransferase [Lentzea flaviverrucosa]|uniref:Glycosyltransferase involved in cell wall bisynthesis n=1 Tax=Lentzea flaviverrucosa TaxID=200379 RepID=A0A1H9T467_9PSEU|nr:glycosyltransferase [Lentzea flaviverrucosa]RDI25637.1 glycosyltransferase involved in cell wall biosynthesis [Lentzea flaviverrucosa]SER91938.1 Glycosyltransferase involved in cell wall bisynthesis [Lentzea flaviverrucosa]
MTMLAITLAVFGAVCFALAARLQHDAIAATGARASVLRQPRWLGGLALLVAGAGVHAAALGMAPLTVVQPIGVLAIGMTALMDRRFRELPAILLTTVGVGAFVLLASGSATATKVVPDIELTAGLVVLGLIAVPGVIAALTANARVRAVAFASAGGVAYAYVSVLMRAVSQSVQQGGFGLSHLASVLGIALSLAVGGWLVQHAYAGGPPHLAVACLTVVDPLVAVGLGAFLLGEAAHLSPVTGVALFACALAAVCGVFALARQPRENIRTELLVNTSSALRVVIAADTFPPDVNGAARFAQRLAVGLAENGHDVHVIAPDSPRATEIPGVTVHRLRSHRLPFYPDFRFCLPWQASREADELVKSLKPDVVHVQAHFVVGRFVLNSAVAQGIPTLATNHFMPENLFSHAHVPAFLQGMARKFAYRDLARVFGRADVVTAPTPRAVQLLHDSGFPAAAVPVSCGIDIARYQRSVTHNDRPTALFVGRLDEEKRVDEFLRALARVPGAFGEIVGDGTCKAEWELLARDLEITDRVRFHGFVSEDDLLDAYARCDLFVMPGVAELQSLATMEAMAAGKPVIAANAMALPHLVHSGRNGWLFEPGDVNQLAQRLHTLVHDAPMRARMGAASSEIISHHALATTLERFEALYARAMGQTVPVIALAA